LPPPGLEQELPVHTVTKILVVFAAILAVLLAALTMAYSVNATRITDDYRAAVERAVSNETTAKLQMGDANTAKIEVDKQLASMTSKVAEVENSVRTLQAAEGNLKAQVRSAEGERDAIKAQVDLMAAANQTLSTLAKSYRDEVTKLRENELASSRHQIELVDRLNDLESQLEVSQASTRALQEQLVEARQSLQAAASGVRIGDTASGEPFSPPFAVNGKVTGIGKDVTGSDTATINLGTNNRLDKNMRLSVFRGDTFIGHLTILKADLQSSMGTVKYADAKVQIRSGDDVRSFASR